MNVSIYTTATCAYCHMLKNYLEENDIEYTEKRADTDPELARELQKKSGQLGVPFTIIEQDGHEEYVLGFDQQRLKQLLGT